LAAAVVVAAFDPVTVIVVLIEWESEPHVPVIVIG
jgi:hypothetical protein